MLNLINYTFTWELIFQKCVAVDMHLDVLVLFMQISFTSFFIYIVALVVVD